MIQNAGEASGASPAESDAYASRDRKGSPMICAPCSQAGDLISALRRNTTLPELAKIVMVSQASDLHGECSGCTCQHVIPQEVIGP